MKTGGMAVDAAEKTVLEDYRQSTKSSFYTILRLK